MKWFKWKGKVGKSVVTVPAVLTIAVKGGTGKTMVSRELIIRLAETHSIAALDSDVDSPNLAESLGVTGHMKLDPDRRFLPVHFNDKVRVFSTSLYHPASHRGWTRSGEQNQGLLRDAAIHTSWGGPDLFIIDMPAGSSDEFSAIKEIFKKIIGVVVVTQPNTISDLERVIDITSRFQLPIIGVVENQHEVECQRCGSMTTLFEAHGQVEATCRSHGILYAGAIGWVKKLQKTPKPGKDPMPDKYRYVINTIVEVINGK